MKSTLVMALVAVYSVEAVRVSQDEVRVADAGRNKSEDTIALVKDLKEALVGVEPKEAKIGGTVLEEEDSNNALAEVDAEHCGCGWHGGCGYPWGHGCGYHGCCNSGCGYRGWRCHGRWGGCGGCGCWAETEPQEDDDSELKKATPIPDKEIEN